jgi:hypothetical protein
MKQTWLQHALRDTTWRWSRQVFALAALGVVVAILMGALYLAQAASVATLGRQLEEMIAKRNQLEQTNEQLRAEIAQLRTVSRLLARARELGFEEIPQNRIEYLYVPGYKPNQEEAAGIPQLEVQTALPEYDESFGSWLQQQWDNLISQFQGFTGNGE